jgi:hypothetical protein
MLESKDKLRRQSNPLPALMKDKEPLSYCIPYNPSTNKKRGGINGDQEGCRLGLKMAVSSPPAEPFYDSSYLVAAKAPRREG